MYRRDQIDLVRSKADIVDIIREYVPSLSASGRTVKGLCPFHNEKTPSFHVNAEKGFYKCFGCNEGGDAIQFITKMENLGFEDALELLAQKVGVTLVKDASTTARPKDEDEKSKLSRLLEQAAALYRDQFWDENRGAGARAYMETRGLSEETLQRFLIGFAPDGDKPLFEELVRRGFSFDLCQKAGLVGKGRSGRYYDPLYGRVIFPIRDTFGHIVGFGGRLLEGVSKKLWDGDDGAAEAGPKYINSPETPLFSKGRLLYGLFEGKSAILANRSAVIVEGYMDVIGLHQAGRAQAVATLGTAFTRDHAKLLKRYADQAVMLFDDDAAGEKATLRSFLPLVQENIFPRVGGLPDGLDPDEFVLERGEAAFDELLARAEDFVQFLLNKALEQKMALPDKVKTAGAILEIVRTASSDVLKAQWLEMVAARLGLEKEGLTQEMRKEKPSFLQAPVPATAPLKKAARMPQAEEEYLYLLAHYGFDDNENLGEDDFPFEREKRLFQSIRAQRDKTGTFSLPSLVDDFPDERDWLTSLFFETRAYEDVPRRRQELFRDIRHKRSRERLKMLTDAMKQGDASPELQAEINALLKVVKGSKTAVDNRH